MIKLRKLRLPPPSFSALAVCKIEIIMSKGGGKGWSSDQNIAISPAFSPLVYTDTCLSPFFSGDG